MKIGLISDIHGNSHALQVCLERLVQEGCDTWIFLGDNVSDTPYPAETMAILRGFSKEHACSFLRGNREDYLLSQHEIRQGERQGPLWIANSASGNLLFTYERLCGEDFAFIGEMPLTLRLVYGDAPPIRCCHGSPDNTRELLQHDGTNTRHWLEQIGEPFLLAGHTHHPGVSHWAGKTYVNPGSCGIPIDDAGYAQCGLLELRDGADGFFWQPRLLSVPYDVMAVVRDIYDSGLLCMGKWFVNNNIHILLTGIDVTTEMVIMASKLQEEATGRPVSWPAVDECFFAQAAAALGMPDYRDMREDRLREILNASRPLHREA